MPFEKDPNELGVLWKKTSARGEYFTGSIEINGEKTALVVFANGNKKSDKAPDYRILRSVKREPVSVGGPVQTIDDSDIPF
jgi:uncharacterized protein (DUF736 family)